MSRSYHYTLCVLQNSRNNLIGIAIFYICGMIPLVPMMEKTMYLKTLIATLFLCYSGVVAAQETTAQKIAAAVEKQHGGEIFLYKENTFYHVLVGTFTNTDKRFLFVGYYETNYDFGPAGDNMVAQWILQGEPRVFRRVEYSDHLVDQTMDYYYHVYIDGVVAHQGWNHEELRQDGVENMGKITVLGGELRTEEGERKPLSPEDLARLQSGYEDSLREVESLLP